jgi:hypothetical protein
MFLRVRTGGIDGRARARWKGFRSQRNRGRVTEGVEDTRRTDLSSAPARTVRSTRAGGLSAAT